MQVIHFQTPNHGYNQKILHHILHILILNENFLLYLTADLKGCVLDIGTGAGSWAAGCRQ